MATKKPDVSKKENAAKYVPPGRSENLKSVVTFESKYKNYKLTVEPGYSKEVNGKIINFPNKIIEFENYVFVSKTREEVSFLRNHPDNTVNGGTDFYEYKEQSQEDRIVNLVDIPGIAKGYAKKLIDAGINNPTEFLDFDTASLAEALEIKPGQVEEMKTAIKNS